MRPSWRRVRHRGTQLAYRVQVSRLYSDDARFLMPNPVVTRCRPAVTGVSSCSLGVGEGRDQFGYTSEELGAGDWVGVVAGVDDLAVADREDHDEALGERLARGAEPTVPVVLGAGPPGGGGLVG